MSHAERGEGPTGDHHRSGAQAGNRRDVVIVLEGAAARSARPSRCRFAATAYHGSVEGPPKPCGLRREPVEARPHDQRGDDSEHTKDRAEERGPDRHGRAAPPPLRRHAHPDHCRYRRPDARDRPGDARGVDGNVASAISFGPRFGGQFGQLLLFLLDVTGEVCSRLAR